MSHSGEFELIGRIAAACHPERSEGSVPEEPGVTGIGDDCAIIPQHSGLDTLVTTDLLIEGRHFLLEDITPFELGWKSAAVNISDIAAMGGKPVASFLSIALPPSCHPERSEGSWIDEFIRGFNELSGRFGVPLLGGDTSASDDKLFINVTVLGECPHGQAVLRSGARPGDLVCVTGFLGDSAAGLKLILEHSDHNSVLIRRHYMPMPRVAEGQALAAVPGVHAMMDISDGIASDLRHILDASECGAEVDLLSLPLSPELRQVCAERGWDPFELAVSGGEDYELLFTMAPEALDAARQALAAHDAQLTVIGRIVAGDGIRWIGSDKDFKGFTHF